MHRRDSRGPLSATLSQHSIRHAAVAQRIIASTGLAPPTLVIEVGAGDGILTAEMASRGLTVIAVERDRAAWLRLRDRSAASPNVTPLLQDFLDYQLPRRGQYAVVGNVPFAITSAILRHALSAASPPQALFLLVQREAAFRWGGFDRQSLLSLTTRLCYEPGIRMALRRRDFDPPPDRRPRR